MAEDLQIDIANVSRMESVPTILDVICRTTGMRFAAVARVTKDRWIACSVLDEINFGLKPGGELQIDTTICNEIRQSREPVIIDHVAEDVLWCVHPTPAMYGFQSYISVPIILEDQSFFGTLCAIDPRPAILRTPETIGMFRLFAELIAKDIDSARRLALTESDLRDERAESELREQFIAVLAHDLRAPMRSVNSLMELFLRKTPITKETAEMSGLMRDSCKRMLTLIDNLLDLARGRLGSGLSLDSNAIEPLEPLLRSVIAESQAGFPDRDVEADLTLTEPVNCDQSRIAQLLSNLLGNALCYGSIERPVRVRAFSGEGVFELSVSNSGDPIPDAALERLFQPFYRSSVAVQNREGLGLGLYIAHEIATAHGGTLTVSSTDAETRFTLRMPSTAAAAGGTTSASERSGRF